jgi:hypothetical protein
MPPVGLPSMVFRGVVGLVLSTSRGAPFAVDPLADLLGGLTASMRRESKSEQDVQVRKVPVI